MKISAPLLAVLLATAAVSAAAAAPAPAPTNEWTTWGYDSERTGWNRAETTLSKDNVGRLKVQWSAQVSTPPRPVVLSTLTAPVVAAGVPTPQGAKNLLFVLGADDAIFALDADTGREVWRKSFPNPVQMKKDATWLCSNTANATPVIDKGRGLIFFMASDGKLRAHSLADGAERMAPVQMVTPFARAWSLNLFGDVVYTTTARACGEIQDRRDIWGSGALPIRRAPTMTREPAQTDASSVVAVDVRDLAKPEVTMFFTSGGRPAGAWGRGGLARGPDDSLILQTSDGLFDPAAGSWGDTILRLSPRAARVMDSFTPENHRYIASKDLAGSTTPVVFPFGDKTLVATAQKEAVLYLLDANDMGGGLANRHEKYVFKSPLLANEAAAGTDPSQGVWGGIATYQTAGGKRFLYVPFWGPQASTAPTFPVTNGATPNGGVMAFEVVQRGDQIAAEPRWTSDDMIMADPPVVANGVVFATSTGGQPLQNPRGPDGNRIANTTPESIRNRSTPIGNLTLYAYDAETGKRLYTSGKTIPGWVHFGEPVVALGKVFLVTHDSRIYAFGLDR